MEAHEYEGPLQEIIANVFLLIAEHSEALLMAKPPNRFAELMRESADFACDVAESVIKNDMARRKKYQNEQLYRTRTCYNCMYCDTVFRREDL